MALKRSEKKALREKVRKFCADMVRNSTIPVSLYDGEDTESLFIIRQEFEAVANRLDWANGDSAATEGGGDA